MRYKKITVLIGSIVLIVSLLLVAGIPACAPTAPATTPTPPTGEQEVINWRMQGHLTKGEPFAYFGPYILHRNLDEGWRDWIEEMTNGRLVIEFNEPESLYPSSEALLNISQGTIECDLVQQTKYGGTMPEAYIAGGMPFSWPNAFMAYDCFYNYGFFDIMEEAYLDYGVLHVPQIGEEIFNIATNFPCPTSEAVKGRKIRVFGTQAQYIEAIGGLPINLSYPETYNAMQLGTVDGATLGINALRDINLREVCTGYVRYPISMMPVSSLLINKDAFDALPEDIKPIVYVGSREYMQGRQAYLRMAEEYILREAETEYGVTIYSWPEEDAKAVTKLIWEKVWPDFAAKSPRCKQLVDMIREYLTLYGVLD